MNHAMFYFVILNKHFQENCRSTWSPHYISDDDGELFPKQRLALAAAVKLQGFMLNDYIFYFEYSDANNVPFSQRKYVIFYFVIFQ